MPPSVAEVATAVPAFVGCTELGPADTAGPKVVRLSTLLEFKTLFGGPQPTKFKLTQACPLLLEAVPPASAFSLYWAISHHFKNGGGPAYIVSVGNYRSSPGKARFSAGLDAVEQDDEPTLPVLTDAVALLSGPDDHPICGEALAQSAQLGDRFTTMDVHNGDPTAGKSINAIRAFTGKGTLVCGARTLAGNDNEWRCVSVRRLFITIEESTRKATAFAIFEPNDAHHLAQGEGDDRELPVRLVGARRLGRRQARGRVLRAGGPGHHDDTARRAGGPNGRRDRRGGGAAG